MRQIGSGTDILRFAQVAIGAGRQIDMVIPQMLVDAPDSEVTDRSTDRSTPTLPMLVDRAKRGDQAAWEQLYKSAYPGLMAYAMRRLSGAEAARDAVAETMARAVASIDRFVWKGGGFDAWLFGILRFIVLDLQRACYRAPAELPTDISDPAPNTLDLLVGAAERQSMRAAFSRLDPDDREILELRVVAKLSAEEVAELLGKRPGAIRTAQCRALSRLRRLYEASEDR